MLDRLLGRAPLKARIDDLEADLAACREARETLETRLERAERRRKEAVRERQTAQEELNRKVDRIEQLTDRVDRASAEVEVATRGRDRLTRHAMGPVLDTLEDVETGPEGAYTAMVEDDVPAAVDDHLGERRVLVARNRPGLCLFDRHGLVEVALDPPRPPTAFETWERRFRLERGWFQPTAPLAFALVRSDLFAIGRYDGEDLVDVDGFEADVMGRHSKGGYSQARFERRREEQIERHLDQVRDRLGAVGETPLVVTGASEALDRLAVDAAATRPVDASGPPAEALQRAFEEFWTTTLYRL